ncbi:ROK family transcriptional regulator [Streptomyces sp. ODS28]|uniref:ROK family transcriptional regulator n=1 Tax=Streptomyces sp. ODS28 TaxID=3136688 RepID=UPI0031EF604B
MAAPTPTSQREMRRRNLSRVLYAVAGEGPSSRAGVAARIGLTRAAVSTLVDELLRAGLLVELGPGPSSGVGRPGSALALADEGPCGLGAEIGVDHLTVCAVDLRGEVRARGREEAALRGSDPAAALERLGALADRVAGEAAAQRLRPAGLAVAVPGLVARGAAGVVRAPNLGWHGTDIAALLPTPLPLRVDNEANYGALAELWLGDGPAAPHSRDFIHVSAQIGIGAALVLNGELLRGTRGFAGELGHVPVWPEGPPCACGGRGCLEQYAGESAVLSAAGLDGGYEAGPGGTASGPVAPGEATSGQAASGGAAVGSRAATRDAALRELTARAREGDAAARRALRTAGRALGIALSGAVNLLDPHAVVLGGTLPALRTWLLPPLERELTRRTAMQDAAPRVAFSALGADGPVLGAAHSVVREVLDDPLAHSGDRHSRVPERGRP